MTEAVNSPLLYFIDLPNGILEFYNDIEKMIN